MEIERLSARLAAAERVVAAARARNERLILWSHEDMALREALDALDAGDEVARLRRLLITLVHAGRALHEDILRHNGGGMWSDSHGAFVAALNAVAAEDLEEA